MKSIRWNIEKGKMLRENATRGNVGFEDCILAINKGRVLDIIQNPSSLHSSQKMFVLDINSYAYCVPFIETETGIFLKTVFPSRKYTAIYLTEEKDEIDP
jgi:hypothetical protein